MKAERRRTGWLGSGEARWERVAAVVLVAVLAAGMGLRPEALAEIGRAAGAAAMVERASRWGSRSADAAKAAEAWATVGRYRPADTRFQESVAWQRLLALHLAGDHDAANRLLDSLRGDEAGFRGSPEAALGRASLLLRLGRTDEATAVLEAGLRRAAGLDATSLRLRGALAAAYDQAGRWPEAEQLYLGLVDLAPKAALPLNNLAYHYALSGRKLDQAEGLARRALRIQGSQLAERLLAPRGFAAERGTCLDTLGWVLYRQGRLSDARPVLDEAVELTRDQPEAEILYHRAQLHYDQGEEAEALRLVEQALALDPTLDPARRLRELLDGNSTPATEIG